jgi:MacB-like periplasmic core domain
MLVESRAWSVVAFIAVLVGLCANPLTSTVQKHLFRNPTYADSAPLVVIDPDTVHSGVNGIPVWMVNHWRGRAKSFDDIFALQNWHPGRTIDGKSLEGERVDPGLFETIGAKPWKGRTLQLGDSKAVVVSYEWARGDATWIGREIQFGRQKYQVVGVMPQGFRLVASDADVWGLLSDSTIFVEMVGKLRKGVTPEDATRELRGSAITLKQYGYRRLEVITLEQNRHRNIWVALDLLKWNFGFVLFIALGSLATFLMQIRRNVTLRQHLSYLGFLILKTAVILSGFAFVWVVFFDRTVLHFLADATNWMLPFFSWTFLLASWGATFWSLRDQQNRCRICFAHLRMPVHSGRWSSLVLDRPRTESICPFGHGTLYVPGTRLLDLDAVNWTSHDDMWHELFEEPVG